MVLSHAVLRSVRTTRSVAGVLGGRCSFLAFGLAAQLVVGCSATDTAGDPANASAGQTGGINLGGGRPGSNAGATSSAGTSSSAGASAIDSAGSSSSAGSSDSAGASNSGGATSAGGATSGTGGAGHRAGSGGTSGGAAGTSPGSASDPLIPAVTGTCPTFTTGTATIGGLSGIAIQVGAKKQGTGSLVFYWHGTGSSASEVNTMIPAAVRQEILSQGGMIVSFGGSVGTGGDCSGTGIFSKDDFKIADLIAACAVRDQGIDPRRIYTTGCSAGGLQAGCMGALRSSYIAATAPNSGGEVTRLTIQDPNRVPAVMTMHGGASDKVGVSFSTTSANYDKQMKGAGSFVINCDHGGGHCRAPSALQSAAWEFMKAHPFGVQPEPYASALPGAFPSYCVIQ